MKYDDLVVNLIAGTYSNIICMWNFFSFMLLEYVV
jgi:hypothetical protein